MAKKIFRSILLVSLFVLVVTAVFTVDELYQGFLRSQMEVLEAETKIIKYGVDRDGMDFLKDLDETDYRITVIDSDGTVIFDNSGNDISAMDNHLDRKEVKEAFETGYGTSTRESATLFERYVYTATLLNNGTVVRLSNTYPSIYNVVSGLAVPLSLVILAILGASFLFGLHVTKKIIEPLNSIDVDDPDDINCYREIRPMLKKLSAQQQMLDRDREILTQRKLEFEAITKNMNEGMVLLSPEAVIIDFNKAAGDILGISEELLGTFISTCDQHDKIADLVENASIRYHNSKHVKIGDKSYEIEVSPVEVDYDILGYVLLIFDESYKEASEQMRKEFATNVSHELKTPLQSISGYAELLKSGIVRKEDEKECLDKIYNESQRMIMLIKDVIKLSHLDDEESTIAKERIDLSEMAHNVASVIRDEAINGVKIYDECEEDCFIYGNNELVEGIIFNLCENAVKYNKEGGEVFLKVRKDERNVYLSVKDTGIGIPEEDRDRIFERFYSVDRAHSKQMGGTGLGLSIVKHSCILNDATIEVESSLNEGSEFIVTFKRVD